MSSVKAKAQKTVKRASLRSERRRPAGQQQVQEWYWLDYTLLAGEHLQ